MEKINVVIGLNYGDEGKGSVTDYLVRQHQRDGDSAVVRFNGGAQAGHTVELQDGTRHVFNQYGSGTLAGADTILSRFMIVNPIKFMQETEILESYFVHPKIRVDPRAMITTPYDVYLNQAAEDTRGKNRHGSCGMGIGETVERNKRGYPLTVSDIEFPVDIIIKLKEIKDNYVPVRAAELGIEIDEDLLQFADLRFIDDLYDFWDIIQVEDDTESMAQYHNIVFEGAQGLCLDQCSSDFPYVTRSSTGLENVIELLQGSDINVNIYYVTRSYLTRHGAGPLPGEYVPPLLITDRTNIDNEYQSSLRFSRLNFNRMQNDVKRDLNFAEGHATTVTGVITCCDQYQPVTGLDDIEVLSLQVAEAIAADNMILSFDPTDLFRHQV